MPYDIAGLIVWAKREDWRNGLAELLDRHSAQACTAAGIKIVAASCEPDALRRPKDVTIALSCAPLLPPIAGLMP